MEKKDLRIVYMGTPEFAVESLKALTEGGYHVVGVVTMPDKPAGRGMKLQSSPVKQYAREHLLPLLQPERLKDPEFLEALKDWKADLQIVVAFRMLPEAVWNMPRLGTFNLHASLLPQYRGAAPINWAIINGECETGVTTFFLTHTIDTGHIIGQQRVAIAETDTAGTLHDRLMLVGSQLVTDTVDRILSGTVEPIDQDRLLTPETILKPAPKIFRDTCRIEWNQPVAALYNFVRGLSPYPAAWTELLTVKGEPIRLKIFEVEIHRTSSAHPSGTVLTDGKTCLDVVAADGIVRLLTIQPAGKVKMPTREFLKGCKLLVESAFP
ncbi:MAG: methionyl-tRNA formyltransferase [Dysgonamonadaceae bacterium]|jgi:methionyl-tRNA formyltransferase|nr:methionyl-tRNA formyltransferase [Dysgonamonadaceae bacterium]